MNPFIIYGYHSPKFFCDRKKETAEMIRALENGRNLTLFSLRKVGKTGLIHNAFYKMKRKHKKEGFVYADISPAEDLKGFVKILAQSILRHLESKPVSMLKEAALMLRRIRPKMSFDPSSGEPSLSVYFETRSETEDSLSDTLDYLKKRSEHQQIFIAIDEFQQILNFPEINVEGLLRSRIQFMNNVRFVFSGSEQKMMLSIFADAKRPFYQSAQPMHLDKIDEGLYKNFIETKLNESNISIEPKALDLIISLTRAHTYYVQYICNNIYDLGEDKIGPDEVNKTFTKILNENESVYYGYRTLLPEQQWKLLRAIALEPGVEQITSGEFMNKYSMVSHSTVRSALKSLISKEFVYMERGKYYVYDVFLSRWLERSNS